MEYLDVTRSVIISSPAGSGKTEKLARRYIELLKRGSNVRRILSITFTEKAAAEMKERILHILRGEEPELYETLRPQFPLMRIHTIHAFCLRLLKRFSLTLGLDPSLGVSDALAARELWNGALYGGLVRERGEGKGELYRLMLASGMRGWSSLWGILDGMYKSSPYPELMLMQGTGPGDETRASILRVYEESLIRYKEAKAAEGLMDFNDLELLAYRAMAESPEWANILYAFDEHTDHLLVDEFQDTSTLQWRIMDKLTEEWRAGMGPKREGGLSPTIFLVGDVKQSIYMFRGANVSVFKRARERFEHWMPGQYHYVEVRDNYRSLPAIVDFANEVFPRIMPPGAARPWQAEYSDFEARRTEGRGYVGLTLYPPGDSLKAMREAEGRRLGGLILSLVGRGEVFERDASVRPCRYSDMAILIRKRTYLTELEEGLREAGVPFVVLKGIGFFDEPEVALLRELISFLVDPRDDYSLMCVLRSPLYAMGYGDLYDLSRNADIPLIEALAGAPGDGGVTAGELMGWAERVRREPLGMLVEEALTTRQAWASYRARQERANIMKMISLVESFEGQGLTPLHIRERLIRLRGESSIPKANINAEAMDAVRIMTIHAAKGLQFPMVFLPFMDESLTRKSEALLIDEDPMGRIVLEYEDDSRKRETIEAYRNRKSKEEAEEKRLFYVAVTRARDYLMMTGTAIERFANTRLGYISDALGGLDAGHRVLDIRQAESDAQAQGDVRHGQGSRRVVAPPEGPYLPGPLEYTPGVIWRDVTADAEEARRGHGRWGEAVGNVTHRLFEEISRGLLSEGDCERRARELARLSARAGAEEVLALVMDSVGRMSASGLMREIVLPRPGAYAELPFVLKKGRWAYRGRIDRVIVEAGVACVYDYKTYRVSDPELPDLAERYGFQMSLYREAASELLGMPTRACLVMTSRPLIIDCP